MELVTERNGGAKNLHGQGEGAQPEASILIVEFINFYMNTVMNTARPTQLDPPGLGSKCGKWVERFSDF